jgi:hypothetical protein
MNEDLTLTEPLDITLLKQQLATLLSDRMQDLEDYEVQKFSDIETRVSRCESKLSSLEIEMMALKRQRSLDASNFIRLFPKNKKKTFVVLVSTVGAVAFFFSGYVSESTRQTIVSNWVSGIFAGAATAAIAIMNDD